jgi:hypothetical protein
MAVGGHSQSDYAGQSQSSIERILKDEIRFSRGPPYPHIAEIEQILFQKPKSNRRWDVRFTRTRFLLTGQLKNACLWIDTN